MRKQVLSLLVTAAAAVAIVLPGTASAQYRGFYRPSNFGNPGARFYQPSNFGNPGSSFMPPTNYGNPGATPLNTISPYVPGTIGAGTPIPVGVLNSLPGVPLGANGLTTPLSGGAFPNPVAAPMVGPLAQFSGGPLLPGEFGRPEAATPPIGPAEMSADVAGALGGATAFGALAFPWMSPDLARPSAAPSASIPVISTPVPAWRSPRSYGGSVVSYGAYSAPRYQSSFYDPLRRVYGSQPTHDN